MLFAEMSKVTEIKNKIEQISASIGLDFDDNELSNNEKDALLDYALKKITEKEYVQSYKEEKQNEK